MAEHVAKGLFLSTESQEGCTDEEAVSRRGLLSAAASAAPSAVSAPAEAEEKTEFKRLRQIQFVAALGDPNANSGW